MFSSKPLRNPTETASLSLAFFGSRKPKNVKMSPFSKVLTVKNAFFLKVTFVYSWWVLFLLATRFLKMKNLPQVKVEMMCFDIKKTGRRMFKNPLLKPMTLWKHHWKIMEIQTRFLLKEKWKNLPQVKVEMDFFGQKQRGRKMSKNLCWNQWPYGNIIGKSWKSQGPYPTNATPLWRE